jgi:hypothetical protein
VADRLASPTIGDLLALLAIVAAFAAAAFLATALKYRGPGNGLGTPGYARARNARRKAIYAAVVAVALFAAGCLTPLCQTPLLGAGA